MTRVRIGISYARFLAPGSLFVAIMCVGVMFVAASSATAYTITLNGFATSSLLTQASKNGIHNGPAVTPTALPYFQTSFGVSGSNTAESTYTLTNDSFDITLDHV